jgi:hypothetical protein
LGPGSYKAQSYGIGPFGHTASAASKIFVVKGEGETCPASKSILRAKTSMAR